MTGQSKPIQQTGGRVWSRYPTPPTYIKVGEGNGIILNISEGGLAVKALGRVAHGELLQVTFLFAKSETWIDTRGRIAWRNELRQVTGVQFLYLPDEAREQIREWMSLETGLDEKNNLPERLADRRMDSEAKPGPNLPKVSLARGQVSSSSAHTSAREIPFPVGDAPTITSWESISLPLAEKPPRTHQVAEKTDEYSRPPVNRDQGRFRNLLLLGSSLALVCILLVGFFSFRSRRSVGAVEHSEASTQSGLGLSVEHAGPDWRLSWNPDAPAIAKAIKAHLSITDGTSHKVLDLDPSDLRGGTMMYTPLTNEVILRLDLDTAASPTSISESIRITSGAPSFPTAQARGASHGDGRTDKGGNTSAVTPRARATDDPATRSEVSIPADRGLPIGLLKPLRTDQSKAPSDLGPAGNTPNRSSQAAEASIPAPALQVPVQFAATSNLAAIPPEPPAPAASGREPAPSITTIASTASVEPAELIDRKDPVYPAVLRETRLSGTVLVRFHIRADGTVHDVSVVKGNLALGQAAIEAVQKWRYKPARLNGLAIETEGNAVLEFNP